MPSFMTIVDVIPHIAYFQNVIFFFVKFIGEFSLSFFSWPLYSHLLEKFIEI